MNPVEEQIVGLIADVLRERNPDVSVSEASAMGDPTEWDSLAFVKIFLTVSDHFGLEVSDDDAISFMSVSEIVDFVGERT
jgi:acyl carrier protein